MTRRHGAATASRAQPTRSGPRSASRASTVIVAPVVPHEIAASPMNRRPRRMARVVYETHGEGGGRPAGHGISTDSHGKRRRVMIRIGFIGVGTMGLPMAKNLVKKGFAVNAFDTSREAVAAAVAAGMTAAASAAETVATADLVITMLPSSPHVESVYTGDGGVLAAARKGTLCVDMSTIDPAVSRRVAAAARERGIRFIDAPVSGGVPRATDGTLAIMVGGAAEDVKEALPALEAMGANVIHVGPVGSGEVVKLCNNLIAGVAAVAVSEAFRIAEGFGVDPKVVTEVISKSSGHTFLMEHMHPVPGMVERSASSHGYQAGFMTDLMCKDLGLAVDAARALRIPVFTAPAAQQVYRLASSHGLGRKDFTSVYTLLKPSSDQAPV